MADPAELMAKYCDGDASAFRTLYAAVAPRLTGYVIKLGRDRELANEVVQVTFMKVHRARSAYVRGADPIPWIYAIAHRTFIDEVRRRRVAQRVQPVAEPPEVEANLAGDGVDRRDDPQVDRELYDAALAALAELPLAQRQAVVLTKVEGKSFAEAAAIAGTTVGAMKVRAHRGYQVLRDLLRGGNR